MFKRVDFTQMPEGMPWQGERLVTCPLCGKIGLLERENPAGHSHVIHSMADLYGTGMRISTYCTLPIERPTKTQEEINTLIASWKKDPCWDLWETEGFEAHIEQLKAVQAAEIAKWEAIEATLAQEKIDKQTRRADSLHTTLALVQLIEALEIRLNELEMWKREHDYEHLR